MASITCRRTTCSTSSRRTEHASNDGSSRERRCWSAASHSLSAVRWLSRLPRPGNTLGDTGHVILYSHIETIAIYEGPSQTAHEHIKTVTSGNRLHALVRIADYRWFTQRRPGMPTPQRDEPLEPNPRCAFLPEYAKRKGRLIHISRWSDCRREARRDKQYERNVRQSRRPR